MPIVVGMCKVEPGVGKADSEGATATALYFFAEVLFIKARRSTMARRHAVVASAPVWTAGCRLGGCLRWVSRAD